jgi:hypothetical protein
VLAGGFAPVEQGPFTQENMPAALEFRLPRSAMVRGRVVRDGVPEQSLEVRLDTRLEDPRVRGDGMPQLVEAGTRTATAKDGSFAIGAGRGGRFVLCVQGRQGALVLAQPLELELERPVEDLVVDLAAAGTIEGRVESTLATRARAAQILYSCGFGEPRCERIAPDGSYRLEGLAPGRWWLRVLPDTSSYSALLPPGTLIDDPQLRALDVTAGATMRCDFDVRGPETHCIEGRARLDDRAPAGWIATLARVERSWDAHRCADPLSAEGRFRLHAANFGTQILALRSPGTLLRDDIVEAHVNVPADGLQWSFECVLGALDLEGQPDAEFEFHADLPNGVAWTTHGKLDSTGRAALDSLPAVKAQLRSATGKASALEIEIPAQGRTHARLP